MHHHMNNTPPQQHHHDQTTKGVARIQKQQQWGARDVTRLEPQVCFSFFFSFLFLLMIYLLTGRLCVCQHQHQHLALVNTNGKEGPEQWNHHLGSRSFFSFFSFFFDYFLLDSKMTTLTTWEWVVTAENGPTGKWQLAEVHVKLSLLAAVRLLTLLSIHLIYLSCLFIHLVVMTAWFTYDVLDLQLRYYSCLLALTTNQIIKPKISSLNNLEGLSWLL